MKKLSKMINLILALVILLSSVLPVIFNISKVFAADATVQYGGKVTYGGSTVGDFSVNGTQAFCMDHDKNTPGTGTGVTIDVLNDTNIAKCLYYGWGGAKQWSGFTSRNMGIVMTSLALDYFHNGNTHKVANDFINYVNSVSMPEIVLNFSNRNLTAYMIDNNMQRTQSTTVSGSSEYCLTLNLQNGVTLVNETRGTENTGSVNVYGGDTFYLKAPLTVNGTWTSDNISNCKYNFQPIVYRTEKRTDQDLTGGLRVEVDPGTTTNISVNWLSTGNLIINKVDAANHSIKIDNTTFDVFDSNNNLVGTITTNTEGIARLDNLTIGRYKVVEKVSNEYYVVDVTPHNVQVNSSDNELTIENNKKTGYIEINKYDAENSSKKIANVKFGIYDTSNNLVQTLVTDTNGYAKSNKLPVDKSYYVKELETDNKYILNKNRYDVNLAEKGLIDGYTFKLNVPNNHKKGNLVIHKVDADDNTVKLENITFKVYDESNNLVATLKTNKQGIARLDNINIGNYKIVETETNQYYRLNTTENVLNVKYAAESGDSEITIGNEQKRGYIEITKYDKDAFEKHNRTLGVANVVFGVFDEQGNKIEELTTDTNGYAKSSALSLMKKYVVKELKTREEYITNNKEFKVNLTENGIIDNYKYQLRVANEHKKGNLHIEKITADDKTIQLGNVGFELYLVGNGEIKLLIDTYYTDANGEIYIENLNTGKYMLKEISTNRWYYLPDDKPIEIKWSKEFGDTNVTIENEKKKGTIKIIKRDNDFNELPLENIKFNVYDEDNKFIETITTNANGVAESSRLRIDKKYHVVESETLQNYVLDETIHTIDFIEGLTKDQINDIQSDTLKTLELKNQHKKGNLVVYKVDSLDNTIPVAGVTFELYVKNVDNPYTENQLIGTYTTNNEGKIEIDGLWTGEFYLKEVSTNIWYKLNTDNTDLEIKADETTEVTITNEAKRGYITIEKQDSEFSNIKIPEVTFNIYDENANFVESITTNEDGFAKSSLLTIDKTYYVVEVATNDSYILTNEFFKVNFVEGKTDEDIENITSDIEYNLIIENDAKTSSLQIIKVDADNNEYRISGATFEITDETTNEVIANVTTDENGIALVENLKVTHTYSARETKSNYKYQLNEDTMSNIVLTPDKITSITFENERLKGQVRVIKVDSDNTEYRISGVTFEILDSNMNVIETLTTDENGEAVSSKLPCIEENYYLREVSTQDTYVLSNEIKEFTLTQDEITNITFENEKIKGKLEITKVDTKDTSKTIQGAVFGIYDDNNNLVQQITTNENGIALTDDLVIGKYYCKELETGSPYYLLNENTYEFEITTNGEIVKETIENEPTDITVDVDKEGTTEIKPGEVVNYKFSNVSNNSNVYLENFKWFDYIPTDYIRLETMTTGIWNQDLTYNVYYKTNKSENYVLFKENLSTQENYDLDFTTLQLAEDEYITETCFDFGKVDTGFRECVSPTMQCESLDTLQDKQTFTNHTKTIGIYFGVTAEADSDWTTIVHVPEEKHEPVLPRTGK